jgi:hypothetical protein
VLRSRSRGAEIKLPPGAGAGAEITNCVSGSFLFIKDLKKFYIKVSYKIYSELGLEPDHNSDLRLRGAGAERNNFGSATLVVNNKNPT